LEQAVRSILEQTLADFELILVDDGSVDATWDIAARLAAADRRIRLVWQPARGLVAALNRGLELARGDYLARMDADDLAHRGRLAAQAAFLDAHPEVAAVGGAARLIDRRGIPFGELTPPDDEPTIRMTLARCASPLIHPAVMMRRSAIAATGGYDQRYRDAEDYALWLRLSRHHRLANLQQVVVDYRVHAQSVSVARLARQLESTAQALHDLGDHLTTGNPPRVVDVLEATTSRSELLLRAGCTDEAGRLLADIAKRLQPPWRARLLLRLAPGYVEHYPTRGRLANDLWAVLIGAIVRPRLSRQLTAIKLSALYRRIGRWRG
jgi:glycosyltransferase involved in cell wall biosynthesis